MKVHDENYRSTFTTTPAGLLSDRRFGDFAKLYAATDVNVRQLQILSRRGPTFDPSGTYNEVNFSALVVPTEYVMDLYDVFTPPFRLIPSD
ncbi:MAG: hypothetical protein QF921_03355 [Pseudomonadales bacterium]|jgi:hypothetical protein|nr:hypothetical protein [Pseudomonadales bacterium]MDP6470563.1 hypothetical protein [Pseudomonadales bacterium]MDP6827865.1 hypothetical protein [Pseudomonadales bacterium]MDP6970546.1 hypothetical protein [Pseudomonadales bacterium]|tara:strand:+ start:2277 stop:2549 length:273 start_codon:yes stop_codon:yes gene_type:complete